MNDTELIEIIKVENNSPTGYVFTIYKKSNGEYIEKGEYLDQVQWIEMGQAAEFYNKDLDWRFQKVFHVSKAIEYGFEVPCNFNKKIDSYEGLTCAPDKLILIEEIASVGFAGGDYHLNELYECPSCQQVWRISKIMDAQRGMTIKCTKSSKSD